MTVAPGAEKSFREKFAEYPRTLDCVHCGLCLPYCPTYGVTGREADSPRGRIYLLRGHAEGSIELTPEADRHLDQCIVCRACETVCPSGIRMGDMMEGFRDDRRRQKPRFWRDLAARAFLQGILPHRARLAALTDLLYFYQRSGLRRLSNAILRRAAPRLAGLDRLLPPVPPPENRRLDAQAASAGGIFPAKAAGGRGKARVRVALFLGCIASEWYADVHRATIRVLTENGCDVWVPDAQTCCGALHRHAGYLDAAAELYARNIRAFSALGIDALVVNAAGCGAALKEPPHGSPGLGIPVRDVCEFLDEIGIVDPTCRVEKKAAYHQPCHLAHAQRIGPAAVESLLRKVPGLTVVPLADSDRCCGAGGIYNLLHPELAEPLGKEKAAAVLDSGADIVVTGNPGCWLQIRAGLDGAGVEVLHPVEVLAQAY